MGNASDQPRSAQSARSLFCEAENSPTRSSAPAIEVHRELGAGLLESAYESCLAYELTSRGLAIERQKALPVRCKEIALDVGYRLDLVVEQILILELKAAVQLDRVHESQMLSYLRLSGLPLGLLINFNVPKLNDGLRRFINDRSP
jgi:GxxExxY protein